MIKLVLVVGARPNFMKAAPILFELRRHAEEFRCVLVHTGQHYDAKMSDIFFQDLELPAPDKFLGVGSGTHAVQTAQTMIAFEPVLMAERPDWVVVVGDVNSTIACTLVAVKLGIQVAHVEAGLRSRDWSMPEEINRVLTDRISSLLLTPSVDANANLRAEGISSERISFVGNVMIDSLKRFDHYTAQTNALHDAGLQAGQYGLVTLHRPSNVDHPQQLNSLLDALEKIQEEVPLVFPVHPRTRGMMNDFGLMSRIDQMGQLRLLDPLGYKEFLQLERHAMLVLTDSGGVQEETTVFRVPCLTLRNNTERPVTVDQGTNTLVGTDEHAIIREARNIIAGRGKTGSVPDGWDGYAASRIVDAIRAISRGTASFAEMRGTGTNGR
jgi:UDP-N-acetylglucosamine 2-epimerase (non-hydrolysing)